MENLVWLITGTSQGFGKELVHAALKRGDYVVALSRTPDKVLSLFPEYEERLLTLPLNLCNPTEISKVTQQAIDHFGRIDVLVNNAGYGLLGAIEEVADQEILDIFEVNFFGLLRLTRAVLPHMREKRSGHIVNISSIVGLVGFPGGGLYSATKFAVAGLSESLAKEVAPLGIHVTVVEPGPFRTDFLGSSIVVTKQTIPDYEKSSLRNYAIENHNKQPGDPTLAATVIIEAILSEKPPLHLVLGASAYARAHKKLKELHENLSSWEKQSLSCDFTSP